MGEMGITSPMSILGGEAGPAVFDEDGFGDYIPGVGDDADEAQVELIFEEEAPDIHDVEASYDEEVPEVAEEVNNEEEHEEEVVESGQ
jgi:chromosome condensin MukBEF MukE localization factor